MSGLAGSVVDAMKSCLPPRERIALHEPCFAGNEWAYVKDCLDTGWVSSVGAYVGRFERALEEITGAQRAIAVVNGTEALHMCLRMVGVTDGDEVLVPAFTFVATANAVSYCGGMPHFVDCDELTLGVDPARLASHLDQVAEVRDDGAWNRATGRRIRALIAMHVFGHSVDLDPIVEICKSHRIELVEDAAESLGSYYKGRHTGNAGRVACLSFNGNKTVTTGGGGAILTSDAALGERMKHLTTTARVPHRWEFLHDAVGYNHRMPNLNAALGCAQLEQLPGFVARKRALAERYREAFSAVADCRFFVEPPFSRSNYWLNAILLDAPQAHQRDAVLEATNDAGLMTRPAWTLMHRLPMYAACPRMALDSAEGIAARLVNLPSSAFLCEA